MNGAVGFTLIRNGSPDQQRKADAAHQAAISHFPALGVFSVIIGQTNLTIWGRTTLAECVHELPDGSHLVLVGTPVGDCSWSVIESEWVGLKPAEDFRIPWDGRVVLIWISPEGNQWILWNDWLGSIPVYYCDSPSWRIASTLEPVVVAANAFGADDIFLPGLVLLLTHGNTLADWTLFRQMHTILPDSVSIFAPQGHRVITCKTVQATDERWTRGWDELIDEMHDLSVTVIKQTLGTNQRWTVPLSSGLDSRLIAVVAAKNGSDIHTCTWGPPITRDVVFSKQIARQLHLPWQRIDLGDDYLVRCRPVWIDLFGSVMHFHGMYQVPFYEQLLQISSIPVTSGLIGDSLSGYDVRFQCEHHHSEACRYLVHPPGYIFWDIPDLLDLFAVPIQPALDTIADMINTERSAVEGPEYQSLRFLTLWGRQNHFTYFQSLLADYFTGVAVPYLNRAYARFCLSLPRAALDDRRLQIAMMSRYYPGMMAIGGTYAPEPALLTGRYLVKKRLASALSTPLVKWFLPEFSAARQIATDIDGLRRYGKDATWPIPQTSKVLEQWMDMDRVEGAYQSAINGDMRSVRKVQAIQAFAYRLLPHTGGAEGQQP
ncbi:MAG: hypothetical protein HPY85_07335 [Anaerolineae bacterium]|nr:hypothetical protein [Anaerolineae bacterium]